jgi:hypothetical protein
MSVERASDEQLVALGSLIDGWAAAERERNPLLAAVDYDRQLKRWYLRMRGEEKAVITVWMTLGERTLQYETYFMPAPEENIEACLKYLLRANNKLFAMRFTIGAEDAIYLVGQLPLSAIDEAELDRIVGSAYAYSEQHFGAAMSIGYASRFRRPAP